MEELDNLTFLALERYFNVLLKVGYVKDRDVNKIILLTFLLKFLQDYQFFMTEDDYNVISNILVCLYGSSCLIPFMQYKLLTEPLDNFIADSPIRISEDVEVRHSEETGERLVNN